MQWGIYPDFAHTFFPLTFLATEIFILSNMIDKIERQVMPS